MAILIVRGGVELYPVFNKYWDSLGSVFFAFGSPYLIHLHIDPLFGPLGRHTPTVFRFTGILLFGYMVFRVSGTIFSRVFRFTYFI